MMFGRFIWYFNRLKKMTAREALHRVVELAWCYIDFIRFSYFEAPSAKMNYDVQLRLAGTVDFSRGTFSPRRSSMPSVSAAEDVWPRSFFKTIDYRSGGSGVDVRVLWEGNRFNHFFGCKAESDLQWNSLKREFIDWEERNPPLRGPHYISVMECSIRVMNLFAFAIVNTSRLYEDMVFKEALDRFMGCNYLIIKHRLSLYSSEGNHTLYELAALFVIELASNADSSNESYTRFVQALRSQVNDDGGGREQSTGYHYTNYQLGRFVEAVAAPFYRVGELTELLGRSEQFLYEFMVGSRLVRFGDWDDGVLFRGWSALRSPSVEGTARKHYKNSGFCVDSRGPWRVILDAGNLGMPPLYGHAHFDFLSLSIAWRQQLLVEDSSTYSYALDSDLRRYFRSEAAHNCPASRGAKNVQLSSMMWLRDNSAHVVARSEVDGIWLTAATAEAYEGGQVVRVMALSESCLIVYDFSLQGKELGWTCTRWVPTEVGMSRIRMYQSDMRLCSVRVAATDTRTRVPWSREYGSLESREQIEVVADGELNITVFESPDVVLCTGTDSLDSIHSKAKIFISKVVERCV